MKWVSTYNTIRWIEIQNNISSSNIYLNQEAKINVNSVKITNVSLRACLDGSVSKGSGCQAWWPKCDPWDPHGGALWPPHRHPDLHRNTQTNKHEIIKNIFHWWVSVFRSCYKMNKLELCRCLLTVASHTWYENIVFMSQGPAHWRILLSLLLFCLDYILW